MGGNRTAGQSYFSGAWHPGKPHLRRGVIIQYLISEPRPTRPPACRPLTKSWPGVKNATARKCHYENVTRW
ncbi:MAG: hypothetical protein AB1538_01580 [Bacillota bacterium]